MHIREAGGSVCLAGAAEREVHSREEMIEVLEHGTLLRATGVLLCTPCCACFGSHAGRQVWRAAGSWTRSGQRLQVHDRACLQASHPALP